MAKKKSNVYIVMMYDYDNIQNMGVFSSKEKAQAVIDNHEDVVFCKKNDMTIEEWEVE